MKGSRLYSIFKEKCPVCHQGEVFEGRTYNLRKLGKMYSHCSHCGHKYELEAGFFYGAMYVSYALTVTVSVATFALSYFIFPAQSSWFHIGMIVAVILILAPVSFRISRMIWMNFFSHYDPKKVKKHE